MRTHPRLICQLTISSEVELKRERSFYFSKQMKHLKTSIIDFKLRCPGKTGHAAGEGMQEIHQVLRHVRC